MGVTKEINIKVNSNAEQEGAKTVNAFKSIKNELKEINSQLLDLDESSNEFKKLAKKSADLKDKLDDLNDVTKNFKGTGVEKLNQSFNLLKESFTNFDGQKAGLGFKVLGSALKALPIFLVIEGVKLIIDNFEKLKGSSGILGKAFTIVGDIINTVIQTLKDLSDWLGLTSFAAEDAAARQIAAAKSIEDAKVKQYEDEIRLAQAAGKETYVLELNKQAAVIKSTRAQINAIRAAADASGSYSKDQLTQINALTKASKAAVLEIDIINTAHNTKVKTQAEKDAKDKKDKEEKEAKEAADKAKKRGEEKAADETKLNNQLADLKVASIQQNEQRELAAAALAYSRQLEDINKSKATEETKAKVREAIELNYYNSIAAIQNKYIDEETARNDAAIQKEKDKNQKLKDETQKRLEAESLLKAQFDALKVANEEAELIKLQEKNIFQIGAINLQEQAVYDAKLAALQNQQMMELANTELTEAQKAEIKNKYRLSEEDLEKQKEQRLLQNKMNAVNSGIGIAQQGAAALGALNDLVTQSENQKLKKGEKASMELQKKQFNRTKALNIVTAGINTAQGIMQAIATFGPPPSPLGIAGIAAAGVLGVAQIAAIASKKFNPDTGGDSGGGASPAAPSISIPSISAPSATSPETSGAPSINRATLFSTGQQQALTVATGQAPTANGTPAIKTYISWQDIKSQQELEALVSAKTKFG